MTEETHEETNPDRFQLETTGGMILIVDTAYGPTGMPRVAASYPLADAMAAGERCGTLNRREAFGIEDVFAEPLAPSLADGDVPTWNTTPADPEIFHDHLRVSPSVLLAETLPAYARTQRQDAEAAEIEREALAMIREGAEILNRITVVREKLAARLTALSATLPDENASPVPSATLGALGPDLGMFRNPEVYGLNRPQPY
jgi:hypothetical protein